MDVALNFNTIVQALTVAALGWFGRTVLKTVNVVERLDERSEAHADRISRLEDARRVA